jgi:glycosyltransferase involved in cell wall biosynthesis
LRWTSRASSVRQKTKSISSGLLFTPGDYHALAKLLRRLRDAPEERTRLGEAGRTTAVERFSVANRIGGVLDLYRDWT